jgi:C-terminal processing protease CtpA/Prc
LADETPYGKRWIFQDVHADSAAAIAGIEPGNVLLRVDGREIVPPEHPVFPMGKQTTVELVANDDPEEEGFRKCGEAKGKKLHFVEPTLVEAKRLGDRIGYLKITMFQGVVGAVVANQISSAVANLGNINCLIINLRGNTGGGVSALQMMRVLTQDGVPVGFAIDRRRTTANLDTENLHCARPT